MAQQTAVDWLFDELMKNYAMNYSIAKQINREAQIWAQAKQMEKEQICDAFDKGKWDTMAFIGPLKEQYYNQTYGKE